MAEFDSQATVAASSRRVSDETYSATNNHDTSGYSEFIGLLIVWQSPLEKSSVRSYGVTTRTKDNNHARIEEFRDRRPSHLEQFTSHSANRNSLPPMFARHPKGPPFWLINSASEDYL